MDTLQTLSNEQTTKAKLLQIVLLALPNFARKLTYKPALRSRIASGATLDPLTFDDAMEMLRHRAEVAGGDFDALFPLPLHRPIYNATQGNPRNLCILCDNVLVNAYARRRKAADEESLAAALADLNFKGWVEQVTKPDRLAARTIRRNPWRREPYSEQKPRPRPSGAAWRCRRAARRWPGFRTWRRGCRTGGPRPKRWTRQAPATKSVMQ